MHITELWINIAEVMQHILVTWAINKYIKSILNLFDGAVHLPSSILVGNITS